jgi:hypothetical protein
MIMYQDSMSVENFVNFVVSNSVNKVNYYPVDREYLEKYLKDILKYDRIDIVLYNTENTSTTYCVQFFACLPELWQSIDADDMRLIIDNLETELAFHSLIFFTHKYLEISIFKLIFENSDLEIKLKQNLAKYLVQQFASLVKYKDDFDEMRDYFGNPHAEFAYIKQKMLLDPQIENAFDSLDQMKKYLEQTLCMNL